MRKLFFPAVLLTVCSCSSSHNEGNTAQTSFAEWEGVTLIDSIGVYQYKDTLYFYNEPSDFIFKIPDGFTPHVGSNWGMDGVHLLNADSTMRIDITFIDRGITPYEGELITHEEILSNIACDNSDIRMAYDLYENGYLKVGYTEDFTPLIEKANAIFDDADGMVNAHLQIVRFTYPDSLAKQAFNVNLDYINPWPNNIYK